MLTGCFCDIIKSRDFKLEVTCFTLYGIYR